MCKVSIAFFWRVAAVACRLIEDPQTHVIEPMIFEDRDGIFLHAFIRELHTPVFQLGQKRNIGTDHLLYFLYPS